MAITRTGQSPASVQKSLAASRLRRRDVTQVRHLWWWGRGRRGWWSAETDEIEERLRRHQALMMHRYHKAMKRRSLWDRDPSLVPVWRLRQGRWEREMSSTEQKQAKVEDQDPKEKSEVPGWQEIHNDFESFKKAVDRAIERDPYGTLFGRRLRSPVTSHNSSWTSWSWIFDPKEIKEDPKPDVEGEQKPPVDPQHSKPDPIASSPKEPTSQETAMPSVEHSSSSGKTTTTMRSSQSIVFQDRSNVTVEYIYDPISGRKIPQASTTSTSTIRLDPPTILPEAAGLATGQPKQSPPQNPPQAEQKAATSKIETVSTKKDGLRKTIFDTMFGEHGIDIPVKTYKPHKVYGYTGEPKKAAKPDSEKSSQKVLESSKKREYDQLRLRTLGNNIDATNFNCEPWNNKDNIPEPQEMESIDTEMPAEKKMRTSPAPTDDAPLFSGTTYAARADEVQPPKSDFLAREGFRSKQGMTMSELKSVEASKTTSREPSEKLQPALDRSSTTATEIPVKRFGTRLQPALDRVTSPARGTSPDTNPIPMPRPSSQTLTEAQAKREDLDLLRASDVRAASRAARVTKQDVEDKKQETRKELEKDYQARKDVDQNPIGVGDKSWSTVTSEGIGSVWQHVKKYPTGIVARTMQSMGLTEPKKEVTQPSVISKTEVLSVTKTSPGAEDDKFERLGTELKNIYEQENGSIDAAAEVVVKKSNTPPFSQPTVKPGVQRDLEIERHTQEFEPKLATIIDKAKSVKRELHQVSQGLGDALNERAITQVAKRAALEKAARLAIETLPRTPYIVLKWQQDEQALSVQGISQLQGLEAIPETNNIMSVLGTLTSPAAFIPYFEQLDKNRYDVIRGGGNTLVFRQRDFAQARTNYQRLLDTQTKIAAAEAAAQPNTQPLKTATVLDDLPPTIPTPGPAAPTAPTSNPIQPPPPSTTSPQPQSVGIPLSSISKPTTTSSSFTADTTNTPPQSESQAPSSQPPAQQQQNKLRTPRISRQERVFSGQQRLKPHTTGLPDPEHFQKQTPSPSASTTTAPTPTATATTAIPIPNQSQRPSQSQNQQKYTDQEPEFEYTHPTKKPGIFARIFRIVRRTILTGLAFGTGAYGIGVIAEALQARGQISGGEGVGPLKRVVLEDKNRNWERRRSE